MNIQTKIENSEINSARHIQSNTYASYNYIDASVSISVKINDVAYNLELQTGLGYDHNDYNMPTNSLAVYSDASDDLLVKIELLSESDFKDAEQIADINEACGTGFSAVEMFAIRAKIIEEIAYAQHIIIAAEQEADEAVEADENIYVCVIPREEFETEEGVYIKQQCEAEQLKIFESEDEANEFIESLIIDNGYIIQKEVARSRFPEQF